MPGGSCNFSNYKNNRSNFKKKCIDFLQIEKGVDNGFLIQVS